MKEIIPVEMRNLSDPSLNELGLAYDQIDVTMTIGTSAPVSVPVSAGDWLEVGYGVYRLILPEINPNVRSRKTVIVTVTADSCLPSKHSFKIEPVLRC